MGWLDVGAGAAGGLESLLKRYREEDLLSDRERATRENERSNLATEQYRRDALTESTALRKLQSDMLADQRQRQEEERLADRARQKYGRLAMNTRIPEAEFEADVKTGGISASAGEREYQPEQAAVAEGVPPALARNESTGFIKLRGTPTEISNEETRKATEAYRAQLDADRDAQRAATDADRDAQRAEVAASRNAMLALAQQREGRLAENPPIVLIADANAPGGVRIVTRGEGVGKEAPAPPAVRTQAINNEVGLDQLDRLEEMFKGGAKDVIGPAEGRARAIGEQIPLVPVNKTFADFESASSAFKNAVIKAITGAQMSEPEATRIMSQIPLVTDKPEVWEARAKQTRLNLQTLAKVLAGRNAQGAGKTAAPEGETPEQRAQRLRKAAGL